jgi:hypothetical protein
MWSWLDHLQIPLLREQEIYVLKKSSYENKIGDAVYKWDELDRVSPKKKKKNFKGTPLLLLFKNFFFFFKCTFQTIECLLDIYRELFQDLNDDDLKTEMVFYLISILTQSSVPRSNDLSSITSQSSLNTDTDNDDTEKLIYYTNKLKKQHVRTLYHAITLLIHNNLTASSSTEDDNDEIVRQKPFFY